MVQPIRCLAIVNRGEAAMRCIRAVKSLRALEGSDIQVVALFTTPDRRAPFVRHADFAVQLPHTGSAVGAYLDHDLLIRTLKTVAADAVWPGWGFVAEDPVFVDRVTAEGIRFLGPSSNTMRALGDKISSKLLAERAGVPVTRWSGGVVRSESEAFKAAERIGIPLVIKASAGGGGRGIRVVESKEALSQAFQSAGNEATAAFGDGRLFVEEMIQGGRHIEVQIVADQQGKVVALGCRDCSVQRRHQKVIEEAPPIGLSPSLLQHLKRASVELAQSVGYYGVGTVEFLVKGPNFFFLEMNPRLQVEHGITEELTNVDLVQLQIRIARGERLPSFDSGERGYAIEARVCAEDPDAGFLPAPGRIARFDPAFGPRLRIDTGVASESRVPPDFDSLIAKVIASGDTRAEAHARLITALRDFDLVIEGGATNKGYLLEVLQDPEFKRGGVDTRWLDRWSQKRSGVREFAAEALVLAGILAYQANREALRANFYADVANVTRDRVPPSQGHEVGLTYRGTQYKLRVFASSSSRYRVELDGHVVAANLAVSGSHTGRLRIGGADLRVLYDTARASIRTEVEGRVHVFGRQTAGQVRASTPSMVVSIAVEVGERVRSGEPLGLLEAMKMEIGFDAPVSGTVSEIRVHKGQQVKAGDVLLVIDPAKDADSSVSAEARLELPQEREPLGVLFQGDQSGRLIQPNLELAARAGREALANAMFAVADEIRRILLGYDIQQARLDSLVEFLEAPLGKQLPREFLTTLAEVRSNLGVFADVEQLFTRYQSVGAGGELAPSNSEQLRLFLRRMRASGAGLPKEFLDELRAALSHYDEEVTSLRYGPGLARVMLRLFATQLSSNERHRLVMAAVRRVLNLAEAGLQFESDTELRRNLARIAALRGLVPDSLADAVVEATYIIFEKPELDRAAERTSERVEKWLTDAGSSLTVPPSSVLSDMALAPPGIFQQALHWFGEADVRRRAIALALYVRRLYAPKVVVRSESERPSDLIEKLFFADELPVIAALCDQLMIPRVVEALCELGRQQPTRALELVVLVSQLSEKDNCLTAVRYSLRELPAERFTLSVVSASGGSVHETFVRGESTPRQLFGMHPEAASRLELERYQRFELERLPAEDDIYCFYGKSREVPEDERIFVLAEVRSRPAEDGSHAELFVPAFERVFHEAVRALRVILRARDPRRRLQWNRVTVFISQPVPVEEATAELLARKLHPATRRLGLERVAVRIKRRSLSGETCDFEFVARDPTGNSMDVVWREPHTRPLEPVSDYVRRVVLAKRRGLIYPYEIIRLLAPESVPTPSLGGFRSERPPVAAGSFEEFDLDPDSDEPRAISVRARDYGGNTSSVVFGLILTPTPKVPEGMQRVLILSDPTRDMGALAIGECDRVIAAFNLAEKLEVPIEWLPVSSGARISMDSGTENLDATARVVRRIITFTQAGGTIHIIVAGINVGAQSYWDALSTMLMHTRGVLIMTPRSSMVLTGSAALAASGSVSAEDEVAIGGYERVMGFNGQAQYYAKDLADAYRILYEYYSYSYVVPGETHPRRFTTQDSALRNIGQFPYKKTNGEGFTTVGEIFSDETNPGRKRPFSMRALMGAVVDQDGGHLERWQSMGGAETGIVWDAHLGGFPICLVGIESQNVPRWGHRPFDGPPDWNGGTLFPQSSKKVARALNSASGNRPLVLLANLSGFDGSPESMRNLQLEYGSEIARAVVNFQGPILFLVVSRYHGGAYVVFSRELNPGLRVFAVEGSFASVIGGGPAAAVVFPREVLTRVAADPHAQALRAELGRSKLAEDRERIEQKLAEIKLEKQAEVAAEFDAIHSVERAKRVGSLEEIIAARRIRSHLIQCLERSQVGLAARIVPMLARAE